MQKPFPQSFWVVDSLLCAGCYPGDLNPVTREEKLRGLLNSGIRSIFDLMEEGETSWGGRPFEPYLPRLQELAAEFGDSVTFHRQPIRDGSIPTITEMKAILDLIDESVELGIPTYLHCWGGHGRTSTVVACFLIRHGKTPLEAIEQIMQWRANMPKKHFPFEAKQEEFVLSWAKA